MKFDDVLEQSGGGFGRFQVLAFLLIGCFALWTYHGVAAPFVVMPLDHWCHIPQLANLSWQQQKYIGIPTDANGEYKTCSRFAADFSQFSAADLASWNRSSMQLAAESACEQGWVYDTSFYDSSAVITYELVCGREWLVSFASTAYLLGALVGAFGCGVLSDKLGRLPAMMFTNTLTIGGGVLCAYAPSYAIFALGRFLAGLGRIAVYAIALVYILEVCGKQYRSLIGLGYGITFGVGYCIMPWVAKLLRSDVYFQLALVLPNLLYYSFWWLMPESPRWLLVNKKYEAADAAIRRMAAINRKTLPEDFDVTSVKIEGSSEKQKSLFYIFRGPILRKRLLIIFFIWLTIVLQYFAVSLNVSELPGDVFMTTFLVAFMEIPGQLVAIFVTNWKMMGRRKTMVVLVIGQGLCGFISLPLIWTGLEAAQLGVVLAGRLLLTSAFGILYFWTPELFPTEVRNSVLGGASTIGRISGMMAAFIGGPLGDVWWALPNVIYGVMGTTAGLLCIMLPETLGVKMADTIDEAEGRVRPAPDETSKGAPKGEKNNKSARDTLQIQESTKV